MKNKISHNEQKAEQTTAGMQIYRPATVKLRRGMPPRLCLPRECRNVRYQRHTTPSGVIRFVPADIPDQPAGGEEVTAERAGKCTYAPMPAGTEGVRYRRVIDRATGIVMLTPISWPQWARRTKRVEETA